MKGLAERGGVSKGKGEDKKREGKKNIGQGKVEEEGTGCS